MALALVGVGYTPVFAPEGLPRIPIQGIPGGCFSVLLPTYTIHGYLAGLGAKKK